MIDWKHLGMYQKRWFKERDEMIIYIINGYPHSNWVTCLGVTITLFLFIPANSSPVLQGISFTDKCMIRLDHHWYHWSRLLCFHSAFMRTLYLEARAEVMFQAILTHRIWQIRPLCPQSKWNMGEILAFLALRWWWKVV